MSFEMNISELVFRFLVEAGLQSIVIVPLILTIQYLAGNRLSPTAKHALWFILLVRLSLPILPESRFSLFQFTQIPDLEEAQETDRASISQSNFPIPAENNPLSDAVSPAPRYAPPIDEFDPTPIQPIVTLPLITENVPSTESFSSLPVVEGSPIESNTVSEKTIGMTIPDIALAIWGFGLSCLVIALIRNSLHYRRLLQSATPVQDERLLSILNECRAVLHVSQRIQAIESPLIPSPSILGFLRPQLLMPDQIGTRYKTSELRHIILHELAHVKRRDPIWNWWATIIQIIHWPNPFVWYAIARQRGDRELATDYLALKALQADRPEAYGRTLIKTLNSFSGRKAIPGLIGIGEDRRGLKKRFLMIAAFQRKRRYSLITLLAVISPLLAILLTDPRTHRVLAQEQASPPDTPKLSTPVETNDLPTREITVKVIEASSGSPLSEILIGYSTEHDSLWNVSRIQVAGVTKESGEALITIPVELDNSKPFTLYALPSGGYSAESQTWGAGSDSGSSAPSQHQFVLKKGRAIGGLIRHADGQPAAGIKISLAGYSTPDLRRAAHNSGNWIMRVTDANPVFTDADGRWTYDGAPRDLQYVELTTTDSEGNRLFFHTARTLGVHKLYMHRPLELSDLLSSQSLIQLPPSGSVQLEIVNALGQPVEGAEVLEFEGLKRRQRSSARTDKNGQVSFNGRTQQELLYAIHHPDYAISSVVVAPKLSSHTTKVQLDSPQPLSGRISDKEGNPIAGATVRITKKIDTTIFSPQSVTTAENGSFSWRNAPREKTFYEISAPGYVPRIYDWTNDGEQISGILRKSPTTKRGIEGLVIDAITKERISKFFYDNHSPDERKFSPVLIDDEKYGRFEIPRPISWNSNIFSVEEEALYSLCVGAEGYETTRSRQISKHEFGTTILFELNPMRGAQALRGTHVYHPDNTSAKNVPILRPSHPNVTRDHVSIREFGTIPAAGNDHNQPHLYTDSEGQLPQISFPPKSGGLTILARRSSLTLSMEELKKPIERLVLNPHGSIRGALVQNAQPIGNRKIWLRSDISKSSFTRVYGQTETDASGHFQFDHVPYGEYGLYLTHPNFESGAIKETHQRQITVHPGGTTLVPYEIGGTEITGRMISQPSNTEILWEKGHYGLRKVKPIATMAIRPSPDDFVVREHFTRASTEYSERHEVERLEEDSRFYVEVNPSGHFTIKGVKPGDYILDLRATKNDWSSSPFEYQIIASAVQRISVPSGSQRIDIGTVTLQTIPDSREQDAPPTASVAPSTGTEQSVDETVSANTKDLRFQVVDASTGELIPNVTISLREYWKNSTLNGPRPPIKTTTDSLGQATLRHVQTSADQLTIELSAPGYVAVEKRFYPDPHPISEQQFFRLYRGGSFNGTVKDPTGRPIPGVTVRLYIHTPSGMRFTKSPITLPATKADGKWSYDGIPSHAEYVSIEFHHPTHTRSAPEQNKERNAPREFKQRSLRLQGKEIRGLLADSSPINVILIQGGQLRGQILDKDQNPISDAKIRVLQEAGYPTRSNQWGWFEFPGTFSGWRTLQVVADGYAPQIVEAFAQPDLAPLSVVLEPSKNVVFKVMDPSKRPIKNAALIATDWENGSMLGSQGTTDENGEWISPSVPSSGVDYMVMRDGFHYQNLKGITPRAKPYEVIMTPALTVTFKVSGANNKAIPRFSIRRGRLTATAPPQEWKIRWFEGRLNHGSDGRRSMTLSSDSREFDWDIQGKHIFKIEAFGHEPYVTRVVDEKESPVELNIPMTPSGGQQGLLTTHGGRPIANQSIYISGRKSKPVLIGNGRILPSVRGGQRIKTDNAGRFMLPPDTLSSTSLVIASEEGFAMTTAKALANSREVTARPWSGLSGTLSRSGEPFPYQKLAVMLRPPAGTSIDAPTIMDQFTTYRDGKFHFDRLPPGSIEIIHLGSADTSIGLARSIKEITLEPGTHLSLEVTFPEANPDSQSVGRTSQ